MNKIFRRIKRVDCGGDAEQHQSKKPINFRRVSCICLASMRDRYLQLEDISPEVIVTLEITRPGSVTDFEGRGCRKPGHCHQMQANIRPQASLLEATGRRCTHRDAFGPMIVDKLKSFLRSSYTLNCFSRHFCHSKQQVYKYSLNIHSGLIFRVG